DRRRLAAAALSAVLPGLGQALNRRARLATLFVVPTVALLFLLIVLLQLQSPARLVAWIVAPEILGALLTFNLLVLAWRLLSVGQAFLDTRRPGPTGRLGIVGMVVILLVVAVPHLVIYRYGTILGDTFARVFTADGLGDEAGGTSGPVPGSGERINVLLVGVDAKRDRTATLTDTMMVASLDPVGRSVSLLSVPRDLIDTPLGNGDRYGPKLNSLLGYADRHPDEFPDGGLRALEDAIGALLDIPIHYYAKLDFTGFMTMVDAVGGVDVTVARGFDDPGYDGFGFDSRGYSIAAGEHHLDGANALAYARSRKGAGESDFTRAARQQQILVAMRDQVSLGGSLLFELPGLLDAVGHTVQSDVPVDRLPELAAIFDEVDREAMVNVVIRFPLVHPKSTRYGDSQEPDLAAIRAMAAALFSEPGTPPKGWSPPG
ncbi:MAG TPA: LCP family protein, partial [Candidatus Limnocylindrales bacterium]|nr:LCP family protein [Candidatus Limnocylindrales bacterium]